MQRLQVSVLHERRRRGLLVQQQVPRLGIQRFGAVVDPDDIIFFDHLVCGVQGATRWERQLEGSSVKAALAQINATVGDLAGNVRLLAQAARAAHAQGAQLVLAPELALSGYPPEDLLLRPAFMSACAEALLALAAGLSDCAGLHLVVGHPHQFGLRGDLRSKSLAVQQRFNAASVLTGGRVVGTYCKRELPNYQVFDERRYFASVAMPAWRRWSSMWAA